MKLDQTFCVGRNCKRKEECERWTFNLETWAEAAKFDLSKHRISITDFTEQRGSNHKCRWFEPLKKYVS